MADPATVFVATCDLAAQVRGRSVPARDRDKVLRAGVGWVPANLALTCFGQIAEDNLFGAGGDLRLLPDPDAGVDVPADETRPATRIQLADQVTPDGAPWACCPRSFCGEALADLRAETGLELVASFEHEFVLTPLAPTAPFSFRRFRAAEPFGTELVALLEQAGLEPETWLPEYGPDQFEVTLRPAAGPAAPDRAVLLRELVRDLAVRRGLRACFAPVLDPAGVGNGVHVHFSLRTGDGRPALFDPSRPGRLSELGARFAAGVLRHAAALVAWTAPSPVSLLRLTPHRWSAAGVFCAEHHREALLRICPTTAAAGAPGDQFNLEYRAADATANPWLVLGMLVRAGLEGIRRGEQATVWPPTVTDADLAGVPALPATTEEARVALEKDEIARTWVHPDLLATQLSVTRAEQAAVDGLEPAAACRKVADAY